jgi:seryl-tRNA synthetase
VHIHDAFCFLKLSDHTIAQYQATQINTKINEVQKQIGVKRKVGYSPRIWSIASILIGLVSQAKENADDLMKQKVDLEKEKRALIDLAAEKDLLLRKKIGTIGNIVHDSVPVSDNEVRLHPLRRIRIGQVLIILRTITLCNEPGHQRAVRWRSVMYCHTTKF